MSSAHIVFGHFAFFEQYFPRIFWMPFFEKTHCKVVAQADKKGYDYFSDGIKPPYDVGPAYMPGVIQLEMP
ncbi:MAG: hypothetical protein J6O43_00155 [Clostridium sp.]|nr:hypothetical protein [Clostridium sp.]